MSNIEEIGAVFDLTQIKALNTEIEQLNKANDLKIAEVRALDMNIENMLKNYNSQYGENLTVETVKKRYLDLSKQAAADYAKNREIVDSIKNGTYKRADIVDLQEEQEKSAESTNNVEVKEIVGVVEETTEMVSGNTSNTPVNVEGLINESVNAAIEEEELDENAENIIEGELVDEEELNNTEDLAEKSLINKSHTVKFGTQAGSKTIPTLKGANTSKPANGNTSKAQTDFWAKFGANNTNRENLLDNK